VVATALAFGLVLLGLAYAIGPISGAHVNPAVTLGFLVARRMTLTEAAGYWGAQIAGGIIGAAGIYGIFHSSPLYSSHTGLGANGYGAHSMIGAGAGGAFAAEVILTCLFVFVILAVTRGSAARNASSAAIAGLPIGLTLTLVHIIGIPIDGTSVNPARSLGAAVFAGTAALDQLWVFIVAPLIGGALAAGLQMLFFPASEETDTASADAGTDSAVPSPRPAAEPEPARAETQQ
jgi:aquaporin Z